MISFRILEVKIKKFRGYKEIEFSFNENDQVVILGGPNGYGKTSFVDAIEWGFTGTVKRLLDEFETRRDKTKPAKSGLIVNLDSESSELSVTIKFIYNDATFTLIRRPNIQADTLLYKNESNTEIRDETGSILNIDIDDLFKENDWKNNFNNRYICSYEKNIKIYEKGRKNLYDLFKLYLGEDDSLKEIKGKLDIIIQSEENKQYEINSEMKSLEIIINKDQENNSFNKIINNISNIGVELKLSNDINDIIEKKQNLIDYLNILNKKMKSIEDYNEYKRLDLLNNYNSLIKEKNDFKSKIADVYEINSSIIKDIKNQDLHEINNEEKKAIENLNYLDSIKYDYESLKKLNTFFLDHDYFSDAEKEKMKIEMSTLLNLESRYLIVLNELEENSKNDLNNAISILLSNAEYWVDYTKINKSCPLCRRDSISADVLLEAIEITKKEQSNQSKHITELIQERQNIENLMVEIINKVKNEASAQIKTMQEQISIIKAKFDRMNLFFEVCSQFNITKDIISRELINSRMELYNNELSKYECHKDTLTLEDCSELKNKLDILKARIAVYGFSIEDINNFDKDTLIKNINATSSIIDYINKSENIQKYSTLKNQMDESKAISKKFSDLNTKISQTEGKYEEQIIENLNIVINKVYRRINRHSVIDKVDIKRPPAKATNMDALVHGDTNFSNIMSSGQITTFALSIFIGLGLTNNSNANFKACFFDDPIQSLDDINIISFIDLLKSQLKSKDGFAEQIFIATCNENFKDLLKYKMKSGGIGIKVYDFVGYAMTNDKSF